MHFSTHWHIPEFPEYGSQMTDSGHKHRFQISKKSTLARTFIRVSTSSEIIHMFCNEKTCNLILTSYSYTIHLHESLVVSLEKKRRGWKERHAVPVLLVVCTAHKWNSGTFHNFIKIGHLSNQPSLHLWLFSLSFCLFLSLPQLV